VIKGLETNDSSQAGFQYTLIFMQTMSLQQCQLKHCYISWDLVGSSIGDIPGDHLGFNYRVIILGPSHVQ
jgi:hypothetical protein